ncbi:PKD domain-containing protein [Mucilaginibacter conchicola]|uniref:PKD domain-containing protein n=1 Tax=Mucilaginibacter conchicola TaxID=2303333 RepID=A0A372NWI0_9SPHI|nr:gliding motility-associated C-terminal domain-containing protein [Mucilaginibacter conchicola]RFZ94470.1 PKD domain-containing protein [Mucilaginibacter conchicola]
MPAARKLFKKFFLLSTLLLFSTFAIAQRQNNIWYFGINAGLNFNQTPVVALTDGKLNAGEACASIADAAGNLLFYTDGVSVWNKDHNTMLNGTGLAGGPSPSSTQVIIVPQPDNDNRFFIFHMEAFGGDLYYSTVDMTGDSGRGAVVQKNQYMLNEVTEKIVATRHANGKDIWVIGHKAGSDAFVEWRVTSSGVSATPVQTVNIGQVHNKSMAGYMRVSPDGTTLAATGTSFAEGFVDIFDFDNATGYITNNKLISGLKAGTATVYGLEFSANSKMLYVGEYILNQPGNLYQIKLPLTSGDIADKGIVIVSMPALGALQMAPDGKIYVTQGDKTSLHSINFPDNAGAAADFQLNTVSLAAKKARLGLPPQNLSNFSGLTFASNGNCSATPVQFEMITNSANVTGISWDFGNPASGAANSSNVAKPSHLFTAEGTYTVTLKAVVGGTLLTKTAQVSILRSPDGALHDVVADKPILCEPGKVNLSAEGATGSEKYNWYDQGGAFIIQTAGAYETPVLSANTSYFVSISNGNCEGEKQKVDILYAPAIAEITASNTIINLGESVTLTANNASAYSWSPATYLDNTDTRTVTSTPLSNVTYKLTTTNTNDCTQEATVNIIVKSEITVPNAFSPNADGVNDYWVIKNIEYLENYTEIFDRNGSVVYAARNYKNNWDGTLNGKALPTGVYYYMIKLPNNAVKSGSLSIIR